MKCGRWEWGGWKNQCEMRRQKQQSPVDKQVENCNAIWICCMRPFSQSLNNTHSTRYHFFSVELFFHRILLPLRWLRNSQMHTHTLKNLFQFIWLLICFAESNILQFYFCWTSNEQQNENFTIKIYWKYKSREIDSSWKLFFFSRLDNFSVFTSNPLFFHWFAEQTAEKMVAK